MTSNLQDNPPIQEYADLIKSLLHVNKQCTIQQLATEARYHTTVLQIPQHTLGFYTGIPAPSLKSKSSTIIESHYLNTECGQYQNDFSTVAMGKALNT